MSHNPPVVSDVTTSQREVMKDAAKIANQLIRQDLNDFLSPVTRIINKGFGNWRMWTPLWNPFVVDWAAKDGLGLRLRDSDALLLGDTEAFERVNEIVSEALRTQMLLNPTQWVGAMINDLLSDNSVYTKLVENVNN